MKIFSLIYWDFMALVAADTVLRARVLVGKIPDVKKKRNRHQICMNSQVYDLGEARDGLEEGVIAAGVVTVFDSTKMPFLKKNGR